MTLAGTDHSLPSGWVVVHLEDVVSRIRSGTSPVCFDRPARQGEHGVLSLSAIVNGTLQPTENKAVKNGDVESLGVSLRRGWILMSRSNTAALVGGTAFVDRDYPNLHLPDLIWALEVTADVDPEWLGAFLQSHTGRREITARAAGTSGSMKKVSRQAIRSLPVPLPPYAEQKRIAGAVRLYVRAGDQLTRMLAAKRHLKRALMGELLTGKRRFKEFRAEAWRERRLGDLFTERVEIDRADLPLLSITADRGVVHRDELERRDTSAGDKSKYLRIAPGDIGYNTMRMWQGVSALSTLEGIVSPAYTICEPGPEVHGPFMAQLFKLPAVVDLFRRHSQGLVKDTLNLKFPHFAQIAVSMPPIDEQRVIADLLSGVDKEIGLLGRLSAAVDRQRRGVMELLLTGKRRVPA